jgi:hypothetical protein
MRLRAAFFRLSPLAPLEGGVVGQGAEFEYASVSEAASSQLRNRVSTFAPLSRFYG